MLRNLFCVFLFLGVCLASPVCFSRKGHSNGWEPTTAPDASRVISLKIALKYRNVDMLESELMAVSDPKSERYGQHYTLEQLTALTAPADKEVNDVTQWLLNGGAENIEFDANRATCSFAMSVENVEALLSVKLMQFQHFAMPYTIIRAATPYCIPEELSLAVHMVEGLHFFLAPRSLRPPARSPGAALVNSVEPQDLYKSYSVTEPKGATHGSSQAPVQFGNNFYSASDLEQFEKEYVPAVEGQKVNNVYDGNNGDRVSIEANLDVQYIIAMGNHVNTSIYIENECSGGIENCFVTYTQHVLNQNDPPLVQSISYGQYGGSYDNSTVQRLNQNFQQMGLRGVSILLASGDNGVGCNKDCSSFEFDFPSSPYITMVGATYFDSKGEHGATLSSGGFSEDYYRPSYQNSAVNGYFNSGVKLPSSSLYDRNGRGYPDVAAAGEDVKIVANGRNEAVSGTSCSAPIFGGLISLLNNDRLSSGKSPMGFLNPWLYQNPDMFNSIHDGNNKYCPNRSDCCCSGFNGAKGWDPVTGLGSPNFPKMQQAAKTK